MDSLYKWTFDPYMMRGTSVPTVICTGTVYTTGAAGTIILSLFTYHIISYMRAVAAYNC
jgi:hypothetical protein